MTLSRSNPSQNKKNLKGAIFSKDLSIPRTGGDGWKEGGQVGGDGWKEGQAGGKRADKWVVTGENREKRVERGRASGWWRVNGWKEGGQVGGDGWKEGKAGGKWVASGWREETPYTNLTLITLN